MIILDNDTTAISLMASILLCACGGSETNVAPELPQLTSASARACDDSALPVVMAHGFLAAGDTWANHAARFAANGHCLDRYHAFDWNSLAMSTDHAPVLDTFIDGVLAQHGVTQIDLFGHSAGGGLAYTYLSDATRAAKVRRYVHIGSQVADAPVGPADAPVDTLNLWSTADLVVEGGDVPGATNVTLADEPDHYAVATSESSFTAIYEFLHGSAPATTKAKSYAPSHVAGRALTLGENIAEDGAQLQIWQVADDTGGRIKALHEMTLPVDGRFGPFEVDSSVHHEFLLRPTDPEVLPVRYFREPFSGDNSYVYLRSFPGAGSIAAVLLNQIPVGADKSVLIVFNASRAFQAGTDSLTLNGKELLNEDVASAEDTAIALFLYDIGDDGKTDGEQGLFGSFPFLSAIDEVISAQAGATLALEYNGRSLRLPADPSASGAMIAVFD